VLTKNLTAAPNRMGLSVKSKPWCFPQRVRCKNIYTF